jgi:Smg protein
MKESVLDVLMYLFETYMEEEDQPEADRDILRSELARAGFGEVQVDRALDWLDGLSALSSVMYGLSRE